MAVFDSSIFDGLVFDIASDFEVISTPENGWSVVTGTGEWSATTQSTNNWNTNNDAEDGWTILTGPEPNWS